MVAVGDAPLSDGLDSPDQVVTLEVEFEFNNAI